MTNQSDALSPLRQRFNTQHYALVKFYFNCSNVRYLTSLITIPKLPQDPPNLLGYGDAGALPSNSQAIVLRNRPPSPSPPTPPQHALVPREPEALDTSWSDEQQRQLLIQQQQLAFQQQQEQQRLFLLQQQMQAQRLAQQHEFEEQQRLAAERERLAREQLMRE